MEWYWVLILVVISQGAFLLVWWLINRGKGVVVTPALADSTRKRLEEEVEAEKRKHADVAAAYQELSVKLNLIGSWYNENREKIEKEATDEFKKMAGDPDSLDSWLDNILGSKSREESIPVTITATPKEEDEEG